MSLVNQVLQDLQSRQSDLSCELTDLRPVDWGAGRRIARRLAGPIVALIVVLPAYGAWQWKSARPAPVVPGVDHQLEELVLPLARKRFAVTLQPVVDVAAPALEAFVEREVHEQAPVDTETSPSSARLTARATPSDADTPAVEARISRARPEAESTLVKRTTADPRTLGAQAVSRGLEAIERGELDDAERHFRAAVNEYPQGGAAWAHLYEVLDRQGRTDAAMAAAAEGLRKATDSSLLSMRQARALIADGDLKTALSILEAHRPARADADYEALLAWLLQRQARHHEAAALYRELLARRPAAADWWIGLAISLESLGYVSEALEAFQRAQSTSGLKAPLARYATERIASLKQRK